MFSQKNCIWYLYCNCCYTESVFSVIYCIEYSVWGVYQNIRISEYNHPFSYQQMKICISTHCKIYNLINI